MRCSSRIPISQAVVVFSPIASVNHIMQIHMVQNTEHWWWYKISPSYTLCCWCDWVQMVIILHWVRMARHISAFLLFLAELWELRAEQETLDRWQEGGREEGGGLKTFQACQSDHWKASLLQGTLQGRKAPTCKEWKLEQRADDRRSLNASLSESQRGARSWRPRASRSIWAKYIGAQLI